MNPASIARLLALLQDWIEEEMPPNDPNALELIACVGAACAAACRWHAETNLSQEENGNDIITH